MPLPPPQPGLLIRYAYLWHRHAAEGREEGEKDRPCAVVLSQHVEDGDIIVAVAPVTHSQPRNKPDGIAIPRTTRARLGLDDEPAWIIVSEINRFVWPGPDLRPVETNRGRRWSYGLLPARLFRQIQEAIYQKAIRRNLSQTDRSN